jgi:hypothetical protein
VHNYYGGIRAIISTAQFLSHQVHIHTAGEEETGRSLRKYVKNQAIKVFRVKRIIYLIDSYISCMLKSSIATFLSSLGTFRKNNLS